MSKHYDPRNRDIMHPPLRAHYTDHVSAMTREDLHEKSDIAAELSVRDLRITELRAQCNRVLEQLGTARRDYEVMNNLRRGAEKERDSWRRVAERLEREKQELRAELFTTSMAEASPDDVENLKNGTATIRRTPGGKLVYVMNEPEGE